MEINRSLIWDYDIPPHPERNEAFKRWYIARVLMRGGVQDLRALGERTIRRYLPDLDLPRRLREFWEWYFHLYGPPAHWHSHATSNPRPQGARTRARS